MNCPICGKMMEQGYVQAGGMVSWVKNKHKISLLPREGEVMLDRNVMGYCAIPARICKDCKKVLLDYTETEVEEF